MTVDPRFYAPLGALSLERVAELTGAVLDGDAELSVTGIASASAAREGDLVFLDGDGKSEPELSPEARLFVVNEANLKYVPEGAAKLVSRLPRFAHATAALALFRPRHLDWQGTAPVSDLAKVHENARIAPGAVIGLSGGIDSAVTAHLAVEALGRERVLGVAMPGPFSSEHSISDAFRLGELLGGLVVTIGSKRIDSSIRTRLNSLAQAMKG